MPHRSLYERWSMVPQHQRAQLLRDARPSAIPAFECVSGCKPENFVGPARECIPPCDHCQKAVVELAWKLAELP